MKKKILQRYFDIALGKHHNYGTRPQKLSYFQHALKAKCVIAF
jgi:hypothetical protein